MKVYLNRITGIEDSMESLLMSKRSYTREKGMSLRELVKDNITYDGEIRTDDALRKAKFIKEVDKIITYGVEEGHTTLLRYIDLSFTVVGLHRGAQDDFDSHAKRLDNRIVRSSTRLATFEDGEKSEYYEGKILYFKDVLDMLGIELPEEIEDENVKYVKSSFGYINEDYVGSKEENDVKRGLYPLAIPSDFIFKCQYPELAHIVQHRDHTSNANPELIKMIEEIVGLTTNAFEPLGKNLTRVKMQNYKG